MKPQSLTEFMPSVKVETTAGKKIDVKGKKAGGLATNDGGMVYDLDYIRKLFQERYCQLFDIRNWKDGKVTEAQLKEWFDVDFSESKGVPYLHHFGYAARNWRPLGGTWEEFVGLFNEVKYARLQEHRKSWEDTVEHSIENMKRSAEDLGNNQYSGTIESIERSRRYALDELATLNQYRNELAMMPKPIPTLLTWDTRKFVRWALGQKALRLRNEHKAAMEKLRNQMLSTARS